MNCEHNSSDQVTIESSTPEGIIAQVLRFRQLLLILSSLYLSSV